MPGKILIPVKLGDRSHSIIISDHLPISNLSRHPLFKSEARVFVVADQRIRPFAQKIIRAFKKRCAGSVFLKGGENTKNLSTLLPLYAAAAKSKLDRHSIVIAIGGGVLGDVTGFFAATYLRGLKIVHIPTTLVAQVDSAIGGKTGVNLSFGKNLAGTFHQPSLVWIDPQTLKTLPDREFRSGLAEVIKYAIIADAKLFQHLEKHLPQILKRDPAELAWMIQRCCRIKAEVVSRDEREISGLRAILNFGHTIGHGIEAAAKYKLLHGEAIAIGMIGATQLSCKLQKLPQTDARRIIALIQKAGLPIRIGKNLPHAQVLKSMRMDKKSSGGQIRFVLASQIGRVKTGIPISISQILTTLKDLR